MMRMTRMTRMMRMMRMIDARRLLPLALAWTAAGCLADLRPPELIEVGVTRASARAGRTQLEHAAEAQGLQAWRATRATELYFDDHWPSGFMAWFAVPWDSGSALRLRYLRGQEQGELTYLEGDLQGCTHMRADDGQASFRRPDGTVEDRRGDEVSDFFIPAIRYLHAFPFRILEATVVAAIGEREFLGREYDLVFATWETAKPSRKHDQFVVWIARDSGRVEIIEYSSREEFAFSRYFTVFDQFETVRGIQAPKRITILSDLNPDFAERHLHQFRVHTVTYEDPLQQSTARSLLQAARTRLGRTAQRVRDALRAAVQEVDRELRAAPDPDASGDSQGQERA